MIIYRDKAISIINSKNPPRIWLIFGTDEGEVDLIIRQIMAKVIDETYEIISLDSIDDMEASMVNRSLFQPNKIIILSQVSDGSSDAISRSVALLSERDYLIVRGADLKKNSKVRMFFETHDTAYALNCYKLDTYSIASLVEDKLREKKIVFDREVPIMIAANVSSNSRIIYNEIEKISLFLSDSYDKRLTVEMLDDLISFNSEMSLDRLFTSIVLKDSKSLSQEVEKIDNNSCMLVIRGYQNFLQRLISVQEELGSIGIEAAMNKLKPQLFGRQKSDFINVVRKSLLEDNIVRLKGAIDLECNVKEWSINQVQVVIQRFFQIVSQ
jgi:DNA polymerase III delta subunit